MLELPASPYAFAQVHGSTSLASPTADFTAFPSAGRTRGVSVVSALNAASATPFCSPHSGKGKGGRRPDAQFVPVAEASADPAGPEHDRPLEDLVHDMVGNVARLASFITAQLCCGTCGRHASVRPREAPRDLDRTPDATTASTRWRGRHASLRSQEVPMDPGRTAGAQAVPTKWRQNGAHWTPTCTDSALAPAGATDDFCGSQWTPPILIGGPQTEALRVSNVARPFRKRPALVHEPNEAHAHSSEPDATVVQHVRTVSFEFPASPPSEPEADLQGPSEGAHAEYYVDSDGPDGPSVLSGPTEATGPTHADLAARLAELADLLQAESLDDDVRQQFQQIGLVDIDENVIPALQEQAAAANVLAPQATQACSHTKTKDPRSTGQVLRFLRQELSDFRQQVSEALAALHTAVSQSDIDDDVPAEEPASLVDARGAFTALPITHYGPLSSTERALDRRLREKLIGSWHMWGGPTDIIAGDDNSCLHVIPRDDYYLPALLKPHGPGFYEGDIRCEDGPAFRLRLHPPKQGQAALAQTAVYVPVYLGTTWSLDPFEPAVPITRILSQGP